MKIASATIANSAASYYEHSESESLNVRFQKTASTQGTRNADRAEKTVGVLDEDNLDPKLRAIVNILERLTGQKIKLQTFHAEGSATLSAVETASEPKRVGWGLEITHSYSLHEEQSLDFKSSGRVVTEDGRKIDFSLNLQFHREFALTQSTSFRAGDALSDPLVISFDSASPIGEGKFEFDLIKGGSSEKIANLASGAAYLSIDKNGDGRVNDGSELFGPASGNGFTELSCYDEDRNGWIDENDSVFKTLRLWFKSAENDRTVTLTEAGIGALSLHAVQGSYDFKDQNNQTAAQIQNLSVALSETGEAKPLYGLNLAV